MAYDNRYRMELTMKELRLHTLIGDVQSCGMDGMSKKGIKGLLFARYVRRENPITEDEFIDILDTEYAKVEAWRERKKKAQSYTR